MDWFYRDEGADCANFGCVEGEVYGVVNGQPLQLDPILDAYTTVYAR